MQPSLCGELLKQTCQAWLDHKAARLGAAIAFYSVLSLSPVLVLCLAIASILWKTEAAQAQIVSQIDSLIGDQGAQIVQGILTAAATNKYGGLTAALIGIFSLLFSASAVFSELQDSLNMIWKVNPIVGKPFFSLIREKFLSFSMVVASGFLLLISLVVSAGLSAVSHYVTGLLPTAILVVGLINFFVSAAIITLIFALIFHTIPQRSIPWRGIWPGAILTAILFISGKGLIGLYLGHAGVASSYGAAGSVALDLLFCTNSFFWCRIYLYLFEPFPFY